MGIDFFHAWEVTCQHCPASIVVAQWRDAAKHGWAVPVDGALQLCPACLANHKARLMELAHGHFQCDNSKEPKTMTDGQSDIDYGDDYYAANEAQRLADIVADEIAKALGKTKQDVATAAASIIRHQKCDIADLNTKIRSRDESIITRDELIERLSSDIQALEGIRDSWPKAKETSHPPDKPLSVSAERIKKLEQLCNDHSHRNNDLTRRFGLQEIRITDLEKVLVVEGSNHASCVNERNTLRARVAELEPVEARLKARLTEVTDDRAQIQRTSCARASTIRAAMAALKS